MASAAFLLCILSVAASPASAVSTDEDTSIPLHLPLFRAPSQQEIESSPHPILWSAHETGDARRVLPGRSDIRLACLLDSAGANASAVLRSLVWTLLDEATGRETQHRLQGPSRDFSFDADGIPMRGRYSEWTGSTMDAAFPTLMKTQLRVRCEYQLQGLSVTIASPWLLLWDERTELQRLRSASLNCKRTTYRPLSGVSHPPLAVTFSCSGLGDTRLLETAVVLVFVSTTDCSTDAATRDGTVALSSNSSASGRDFFGFAFGGRVRFGWTVGGVSVANASALPGAKLEQKLETRGTRLCLILSSTLSSGQVLLLSFSIPKVAVSASSAISPEEPLIEQDETRPTEVQLDELTDPPERALPCPLLCLTGTTSGCRHRWVGPRAAAPSRTPPTSQPQSLLLRFSDAVTSGLWTCRSGFHRASTAYVVTVRPRPAVCRSRMPRHSVVFPADTLNINCSLCGLGANASAELQVFASTGSANYKMERTMERRPDGSVTLGLWFSEFQPDSRGATLVLRCRAVEPSGARVAADFATIALLPTPTMRPLDVCASARSPCRADCRSPLMSRLRPLGVSVSYLFSVFSPSGRLLRVMLDRSGVVEDVRRAVGQSGHGVLRVECRQLFYYSDGREGLSAVQTFSVESQRDRDLYRAELGDRNYKRLILAMSDETATNTTTAWTTVETVDGRRMPLHIFILIIIALAFPFVILALVFALRMCKVLVYRIKYPEDDTSIGCVPCCDRQLTTDQADGMQASNGAVNANQNMQQTQHHQQLQTQIPQQSQHVQQTNLNSNYDATHHEVKADMGVASPSTGAIENSLDRSHVDPNRTKVFVGVGAILTDSQTPEAPHTDCRDSSVASQIADMDGDVENQSHKLDNQRSTSPTLSREEVLSQSPTPSGAFVSFDFCVRHDSENE